MYSLPQLPYSYEALEPVISREIMRLHHAGHHQAYVDKLNQALAGQPDELKDRPLVQLLAGIDELPNSIRTAVRNNGGGHYNHSLFWQVMSPNGGGEPVGKLAQAIEQKYSSFAAFKAQFTEAATGLFGSGWVWLTADLSIETSPNQDSPIMNGAAEPLLGLDVWEHAYYLDYKNKRADYIEAWWDVIDWEFVAERFQAK
ncbi:superoxide dismutase [Candidatus Saccharibacteria bacterium 32-49-12]|nr:MAG: superoxide dismutase [Candidatus Saccharibacteria bacterium 32-49-12]